jgi:hypothetical protein
MVPTVWRKSSFSGQEVNCVEVATHGEVAAIRDSKNPSAGHLTLAAPAYRSWIRSAKRS